MNYTINEEEVNWGTNYNIATGVQLNNRYIKSDYFGEWSIIKFPYTFILTKYVISVAFSITRRPALRRLYGSNDGGNWYDIREAEVSTPSTASDYPSNKYEKVLNTSFNTAYQYIGITFNKIIGAIDGSTGNAPLAIQELQLFGKEFKFQFDSIRSSLSQLAARYNQRWRFIRRHLFGLGPITQCQRCWATRWRGETVGRTSVPPGSQAHT